MKPITLVLAVLAAAISFNLQARAQSLEFGPPYTLQGGFENPFGVAVNSVQGHLVVSDTRNRQLRYTTLSGIAGSPVFTPFGGVADPAAADALVDPQGLAADTGGNVYVADAFKNRVSLFSWQVATSTYVLSPTFASATQTAFGGVPLSAPRDVAIAPDGKVYLLDSGNKRVLRADGPTDTSWELFLTDGTLSDPHGIHVAPDGRVYVADTGNSRIVRYDANGATPGQAIGRFGIGYGEMRYPRDMAVDIDNRIYVVDTVNHRLLILDGNGQQIYALGRAPTFGAVQKLTLGAGNQIFIVDSDRDAVIVFLGRDVPVPFDGFIRDYVGDTGAEPSDPAFLLASPDILVRHVADVNLAALPANGLSDITFQQPLFDRDNFVYVTVRNRGTQELRDAVARFYWMNPSGPLGFPSDWKDDGFFTDSSTTSTGNALSVPPVPPAGAVTIGPIRFRPPAPESAALGDGAYALGVRIVQPFDVPSAAAGAAAVRASNNVATRAVRVRRSPFPIGDQNTLVVRVRYADDATPIALAPLTAQVNEAARWMNEVSWTMASIQPLFRGEITLPQTRAYYRDPSRHPLVEMSTDALNMLLQVEPDLLDGPTISQDDDITRLVLVTNDTGAEANQATTGPWPYHTAVGDRYLTTSIHSMNSTDGVFKARLSHHFGLVDLFAYPNVSFPRPFADGWDALALPFSGVHPLVWSKEQATWTTARRADVLFVPRPARGATFSTGANPIELHLQSAASAGKTIAIALGLTPGVGTFTDETAFYYIEARSKSSIGTAADHRVPASGVLMYYVNTQIPPGQGPVILRDYGTATPGLDDAVIGVGQSENPAGTGITAGVRAGGPGGAEYLIDLTYTPPLTGYDASLRTGNPPWTSPDIWVDNQADGYDTDRGRLPTDRGDVAVGQEENRLYARIHNSGPTEAFDIEVAFFISEPYRTVGGEADFTLLRSEVIPRLPRGPTTVFVPWTPTIRDPHTCVKVVLRRLVDDINSANNAAQQNLEVRWSGSSSPYEESEFEFQVTNDEPNAKLVYLRADRVPDGWFRQLSPERAQLAPGEKLIARLRVQPPPDEQNCTRHDLFVTAWTPQSHTLVRMGGATATVNLAKRAGIDLTVDSARCDDGDFAEAQERLGRPELASLLDDEGEDTPPGRDDETREQELFEALKALVERADDNSGKVCVRLRARGCTDPAQPNAEVIVRYLGPDGQPIYRTVRTDVNGCFDDFYVAVDGGTWEVDATVPAQECFTPAVAGTRVSVSPPTPDLPESATASVTHFLSTVSLAPIDKASTRCPGCKRITVSHKLVMELAGAADGAAGQLIAAELESAFSGNTAHGGVHSGEALLRLADGTVAIGEVRGVVNARAHPNSSGAPTLDGQFTGLAIDGPHRGCRLALAYAINLDANPGDGPASGEGKADGVWTCMCKPEMALQPPQPLTLSDGCVFAFAADGKGSLSEHGAISGICESSPTRQTAAAGEAMIAAADSTETLSAAYASGSFQLRPVSFLNSRGVGSPGFYAGQFEMIGAAGERISGRIEGPFGVDPHRADGTPPGRAPHLEGTISGTVNSGPLEGCTMLGVASAHFSEHGEVQSGPLDWSLRGSIVCNCRQQIDAQKMAPTSQVDFIPPAPPADDQADPVEPESIPLALSEAFGRNPMGPSEIVASLDLQATFAEIDRNGSDVIEFDEFDEWAGPMQKDLTLALDTDRDGRLAGEELTRLPYRARLLADLDKNELLDRGEIESWMQEGRRRQYLGLDTNNSGGVSFSEFQERGAGPALQQQ